MTKKYILTGGPGTGKSSILLALENKGEYTIAEAAEDIIKYQKALGNNEPWKNPNFQDWILELQLQRERKISEGIERVFIDRGILDGAAYYIKDGREYSQKLQEAMAIKRIAYQKRVFLIQNLGNCLKTEVRRENLEESIQLERILEKVYRENGYEIIKIGPGTVEERANRILKEI